MVESDVPTRVSIRCDNKPYRFDVLTAAADRWDRNKTDATIAALETERDLRRAILELVETAEREGSVSAAEIVDVVDERCRRLDVDRQTSLEIQTG